MTVVSNPNDLGEAVRVAGKQLRLTQSQIALAAGVGVRFIVELESGKPTVRLARDRRSGWSSCWLAFRWPLIALTL